MNRWATIHQSTFASVLEPGETLKSAERVVVAGRLRQSNGGLPRTGFVLAVTDRRILALRASRWLAHPRDLHSSWQHTEGVVLSATRLGRLRLLLPDRSIVTLRPFGLGRIAHLAD